MTEQTEDAEVEALCTALLSARWHHGGCTTQSNMQRKIIAASLLDSDWLRDLLAAREAAARAEALREAATWVIGCEHVTAMRWCGICDQWRAWLEEEAASIARTDGAGRGGEKGEQDHDCAQTCACGGVFLHERTTALTDSGLEEHTRTICGRLSDVDRMLRSRIARTDGAGS